MGKLYLQFFILAHLTLIMHIINVCFLFLVLLCWGLSCSTMKHGHLAVKEKDYDFHTCYRSLSDVPDDGCHSGVVLPARYEEEKRSFYEYDGDYSSTIGNIEVINVSIQPASHKWVRKIADPHCTDSLHCLVWCLIELPAVDTFITVVKDISLKTPIAKQISR